MSDIKKLIAKGECKTVEFKAALPKGDNLSKTVIAFSNMAGGKIVMGVEDKTGRIIGINDNEAIDFPDKISNIIYDRCNPSILPEIYVVQINGATVLVVEIFPGPLKPYYLKKKGKLFVSSLGIEKHNISEINIRSVEVKEINRTKNIEREMSR